MYFWQVYDQTSRIQWQIIWNSHKHQLVSYALFNMVMGWLNMSSNTSNLQNWNNYLNALSKKFLYICLKNVHFENCATSNTIWKVWYTYSESHQNSAPILKKQLRIQIRTGRARWANVMKSPNSHYPVVIHTNILISNLFSDAIKVLSHSNVAGLVKKIKGHL